MLPEVLKSTHVTGNLVHDAHLVALSIEHGVDEILTPDQDFRRFPQISSRNPFPGRGLGLRGISLAPGAYSI